MIKKARNVMLRLTDVNDILRDGVAIVTGAGTGLGRALAVELARRGIQVVGFGRRKAALETTASLIEDGLFTPIVVDVSDDGAVRAAFAKIRDEIGEITILINNAAVHSRLDFLQETAESFMKSVEVNLGGVVSCTHAALQTMSETGVGRIVNVGSFADLAPQPGSAAYSVSKGAARILTLALVADLSDRFPNIVISSWMPGILATEMGLPNGLDPTVAAKWGVNLALWHDRSLNGAVFEQSWEILRNRSLKRRVKDLILLKKAPVPRSLDTDRGADLD